MFRKWVQRIRRALQPLPVYREVVEIRDALYRVEANIGRIEAIEAIRTECLLSQDSRYKDVRRLHRYSFTVNSQNGEDGMIQEIFRRIGVKSRLFVEVGVGDGTENNTAFLLCTGWTGFWIDGSDAVLRTLNGRRDLQECLTAHISFLDRENVTGVFERLGVPKEFDLLSLDIDQNTFHIWGGLKGFSPRVVVAEYNASIPPDVEWAVRYDATRSWDGTQNFGASLKAFERLGERLGYSLVGCDFNGVNAFFVRRDLVADSFAGPYTAENHYEPPRYRHPLRRGHPRAIMDRGAVSNSPAY
jgi:hypothetical protein